MIGFILKIIVCPITLLISDYLFKDIYYPYTYQPISVGIMLAVVAHLMELTLLKPGTLIISTIADFLAAFVVIYSTQFLLPGATATLIGASLASTFLALIEYFEHLYLIYSGKTEKE